MANAEMQRTKPRPLSPHLQIYSPLINMVMSIVHRITGAALYFGTLLLAWWLIAAATGPDQFSYVSGVMGSVIGLLVLFGYTWALLHHMLGGIRHFIWDTGHGFNLNTVNLLSWGTIALSAGLTVVVWIVGLSLKGGV
ncbi:MAG: succinate dehydrogenase, cytochrome b556 subunit [Hyphomicrobiaceae bacterium]